MIGNYNPTHMLGLNQRVTRAFAELIGVNNKPGGEHHPVSTEQLVYMYNTLGEMVNGLVEMELDRLADEDEIGEIGDADDLQRLIKSYSKCPRCGNTCISIGETVCKICGLPVASYGRC